MCVYTGLYRAFELKNARKRRRRRKMEMLIGMLLLVGGTLKYIRNEKTKLTITAYLLSLATSAFVGMVAVLALRHFGVSAYMQGAVAAIVGYCGGDLLDVAAPLIIRGLCKKLDIEPFSPRRRKEDLTEETDIYEEA